VSEVSVLSPAKTPAEPLAEVIRFAPANPSAPVRIRQPRVPAYTAEQRAAMEHAAKQGRIYRPNTGVVLGVR
jgi:hypothetical protein